jgi:hypothetical protein
VSGKEFLAADPLLDVADNDGAERLLTELEGAERTLRVMLARSQEDQDIKDELFEVIESLEAQEIQGQIMISPVLRLLSVCFSH